MTIPAALLPPERVLLGPGPSPVPASVLQALGAPTVGHLDPYFLQIMDELRGMLRTLFGTSNQLTIPISGTGSAGMEACLANLIQPGDPVLIGVNGVFGGRMCEVAERLGAQVAKVAGEWGRAMSVDAMRSAAAGRKFRLIGIVQAETSTGAHTHPQPFRALADELGALLVVDAVTSLGGMPVQVDEWGIDAIYSGTQKCLSCPPGLSPISFSPKALAALQARTTKVSSWYLDLSLIAQYWGSERVYHHTAPINMVYGLHEATRLILTEGVATRIARHTTNSRALIAGLEAMGLSMQVPAAERLTTLNAVRLPAGVNDLPVRQAMLQRYGIEIGGGLGPLKGQIWRIGLMGAGSTRRNVTLCLAALAEILRSQGYTPTGDPLAAAAQVYAESVR